MTEPNPNPPAVDPAAVTAPGAEGAQGATPGAPAQNQPPADPPADGGQGGDGKPPEGGNALEAGLNDADGAPKGTWPDDWREQLAKGDEKKLAQLKRFSSPADLDRAYTEMRTKLSKGEIKAALKADASPEEVAEWRKDNGVPDTWEGYDITNLSDGLVVGEDDKPHVESFMQRMHKLNASPDVVRAGLEAYYQAQEDQIAARQEFDDNAKNTALAELKQTWGADYKGNINRIENFLKDYFPGDLEGSVLEGRLSDGTPLFSHAGFMQAMDRMARELNPDNTLLPNRGQDNIDSIDTQIKTIEDFMEKNRDAYFKDEAMQKRYNQLLELKLKYTPKKDGGQQAA